MHLVQNPLDPEARQLQTTILTTYIIVAGLLTTSTYPAVYTPTVSEVVDSDTGSALLTSTNLIWLFRMFNGMSFVCSLAAIIGSFSLIICLNTKLGGYQKIVLPKSVLRWWNRVHHTVQVIFLMALASAAAAMLLAALRFDRVGYGIACLSVLGLGLLAAVAFGVFQLCSAVRHPVADHDVPVEEMLVIADVLGEVARERIHTAGLPTHQNFVLRLSVHELLPRCIKTFRERYPTDPLPYVFSSRRALITHLYNQSWGLWSEAAKPHDSAVSRDDPDLAFDTSELMNRIRLVVLSYSTADVLVDQPATPGTTVDGADIEVRTSRTHLSASLVV